MIPTVIVSARGEERLNAGHPWIYRIGCGRSPRRARRDRASCEARGAAARQRAVQQPIADRAADAGVRRHAGRRGSRAHAPRGRDRLPRVAWPSMRRPIVWCTAKPTCCPRSSSIATATILSCRRCRRAMDRLLPAIVRALEELLHPARHPRAQRSAHARARRPRAAGRGPRGEVPDVIQVSESGIEYDVDVRRGQKTGLFLDQRENRAAAAQYARGRLLDCFSYNGGFALASRKAM